VKEK
jgi:predicted PurR-regulated permease PerM